MDKEVRKQREKIYSNYMSRFHDAERELKKWTHLCQYSAYNNNEEKLAKAEAESQKCFQHALDLRAKFAKVLEKPENKLKECLKKGSSRKLCLDEYRQELKHSKEIVFQLYNNTIEKIKKTKGLTDLYSKLV